MNLTEPFAIIFSPLTSWRSRLIYLTIFLLIGFWVDSQMGFTYHYFTQRKIDEVSRYISLLDNKNIDSTTKGLIKIELLSVINKKRAIVESKERYPKAGGIFYHLSYSWIYLLLAIFGIPLLRKSSPYSTPKEIRSEWLLMMVGIVLLAVIGFFIAKLISPYLAPSGLYIANSLIQIALLVIIVFATAKKK